MQFGCRGLIHDHGQSLDKDSMPIPAGARKGKNTFEKGKPLILGIDKHCKFFI